MKKAIQISVLILVILVPLLLAGQPLPYDPGIGGGTGGNPVGGGAPLGEGIIFLLSLGLGYGVRKYRQARKMI
jgi:hypothetical protein